MDGEAPHRAAVEEHCAVVSRRVGIEQAQKQRLGEPAFEHDAALQVSLDGIASRQDQERAAPRRGQLGRSAHELRRGIRRRRRRAVSPQQPEGDTLEAQPEIGLEEHHDQDQEDREEALEDPRHETQTKRASQQVHEAERTDPDQRQIGARAAQPRDRRVGEQRHEQDVGEIRQRRRQRWHVSGFPLWSWSNGGSERWPFRPLTG